MRQVSSIKFLFMIMFASGLLASITIVDSKFAEAQYKKSPKLEYSSDYNRYSNYEPSYNYDDNYNNEVIVTLDLYQCEPSNEFECNITETNNGYFVTGPENTKYKSCNNANINCPISHEDFNIKIITGEKLPGSKNSLKVSLDKNNNKYFIEQEGINANSMTDKICKGSGFDHGLVIQNSSGNEIDICMLFEGNCNGNIEHNENKECIIKNYIPINSIE
ncbi:MAG: hypothetical protein ACPKPY_10925 [Nitrososphaeraceae archaeon]